MTFNYAPAWRRLIAYLIDIIIVQAILVLSYLLIGDIAFIIRSWIVFWTYMIYNIIMDYKYQGTLGKMLLRIKVITIKGQAPDLKTSFYRNFGKLISALPLLWGFIRILTPSTPQTIHDELARCYVIELKKN